eukprot:3200275-Pyramimonas_sp.AAC.1
MATAGSAVQCHIDSKRKRIIRSACLKYLDARVRSDTGSETRQLVNLCYIFRSVVVFLKLTLARDELQGCLAQQSAVHRQKDESRVSGWLKPVF